jgi:hypothetical protein
MSTACGRKNVAVAVTATWVFLLAAYAPTYPRAARERAGGERARERRAELDEKVGATLPIISDQNTAILGGASRVRTASEEGGAGVDNCKRVERTVVERKGLRSRAPLCLSWLFFSLLYSWLFSTNIFAAPHAFLGRAKIVLFLNSTLSFMGQRTDEGACTVKGGRWQYFVYLTSYIFQGP